MASLIYGMIINYPIANDAQRNEPIPQPVSTCIAVFESHVLTIVTATHVEKAIQPNLEGSV